MGSSLPTAALALALVSLVTAYGQPNGAGFDDNLEQLSTSCIFSKITSSPVFEFQRSGQCSSSLSCSQFVSSGLSNAGGQLAELSPFERKQQTHDVEFL
jgi:hypothetical protein